MTIYRIAFNATVWRDIEVPEGLEWHEAYDYAHNVIGWDEIAHSAAAQLTIDTKRIIGFNTPEYLAGWKAYWKAKNAKP